MLLSRCWLGFILFVVLLLLLLLCHLLLHQNNSVKHHSRKMPQHQLALQQEEWKKSGKAEVVHVPDHRIVVAIIITTAEAAMNTITIITTELEDAFLRALFLDVWWWNEGKEGTGVVVVVVVVVNLSGGFIGVVGNKQMVAEAGWSMIRAQAEGRLQLVAFVCLL